MRKHATPDHRGSSLSGIARNRRRRTLRGGAVFLIAVTCSGILLPAPSARAANPTVAINDGGFNATSFSPNPITVTQGDTVIWMNNGPSPHTTTSNAGQADSWDSGLAPPLSTGDSFQHTFNVLGTFTYFCNIHPSMTGVVNVVVAATNTPVSAVTSTPVPAASSTAILIATSTPAVPTTMASSTPLSTVPPATAPLQTAPGGVATTAQRAAVLPQTGSAGPTAGAGALWTLVAAAASLAIATLGAAMIIRGRGRA